MFIREAYVVEWLRQNYPDVDFGVSPIPALKESVSAGGPYLFVVSKDAVHRDEAWRLVSYMMSDEVYRRYADIGGVIPTTASIGSEPKYRDDPDLKVFVEQEMASLRSFPLDQRVTELLGAYIERFCYGHMDGPTMLRRAEDDINRMFAANRENKPAT
ncbi:MAG: extracellular solute-binding protein [Rhodothermales bacterium]|nr:extracellular solute-binding protein [Rhodothermales bacterium]